ncbi:hypothetical protein ASE74_16165 [Pedobacter sp. Leaf216]|nr:hypothetical protein ASE74_16165 [Pedobacter sp. Leaf216]
MNYLYANIRCPRLGQVAKKTFVVAKIPVVRFPFWPFDFVRNHQNRVFETRSLLPWFKLSLKFIKEDVLLIMGLKTNKANLKNKY